MARLKKRTFPTLPAIASLTLLVAFVGVSGADDRERGDDPPDRKEETEQAAAKKDDKEQAAAKKNDTEQAEAKKQDVEDPAREDRGRKADETFVFTNEDLEARYGPREPARPARVSAKNGKPNAPSPQGAGADPSNPASGTGVAAAAEPDDDTAARRAAVEAEIERLRLREASLRNPFLPRVETTDEEKKRESGKDNAARLREVQLRIRELEKELAELG